MEWIYCTQVVRLFADELNAEDVALCEESIAVIGDYCAGSGSGSAAVGLLERWRIRNSRDDGSTGAVNVRYVFEDILGALAGQCSRNLWLDRFSYPLAFHPDSPLNSGVVRVSDLETDDEYAVHLFRGMLSSVAEIKNLRAVSIAELELIRVRCFGP